MILYDIRFVRIIDHPNKILLQEDIRYDVMLYLDWMQLRCMELCADVRLIFAIDQCNQKINERKRKHTRKEIS